MSVSFIFLSAVVCISITLFAYLFYSIPGINRLLRIKQKQFFDVRLIVLTFSFYVLIFISLELLFLYQESYSFFAFSWPLQITFFTCVTILVLGAIRCASGNISISAPHYFVEKLVPLHEDFENDAALFLEIIADHKGEVILDAPDKKIIIACLPLASFGELNSQQKVMIECTFSESFLKSALVQIVCYPAFRGVFIEKTTMNLMLNYLEFKYIEKILKSLS